jgi:hypothetical protein
MPGVTDSSGLGVRVSGEHALEWMRGSLAQGSDIAAMVLPRLARFDSGHLLVPAESGGGPWSPLSDTGGKCHPADSDRVAEPFIATCSRAGARTLVVEDDVARKGDPGLSDEDVVYVSDRVLRWADLGRQSARSAVALLRSGASGYPLNAYLVTVAPNELGLMRQRVLTHVDQRMIAVATIGLVATVYDAEALLAVIASELDGALQTE